MIQLKKRSAAGPAPPAHDDLEERHAASSYAAHGVNGTSASDADQQAYNPLGPEPPAPPPPSRRSPSPPPPPSPKRSVKQLKEVASPRAPSEPPPSPAEKSEEEALPAPRGSAKEAPQAPTGPALDSFATTVSLLDVMALSDLIRTFHSEVDTFVRRESEKLFEQEARNQQARRSFQEVYDMVRGFLDEFAPEGAFPDPADNSDSGVENKAEEPERDLLTKRLLPQFTSFVTDDQRAMQDAVELLTTFVQRHFKNSKELTGLLDKPSPLPLFRSLLRLLVAELGLGRSDKRSGAGRRGEKDDREDRKEHDVKDRSGRRDSSDRRDRDPSQSHSSREASRSRDVSRRRGGDGRGRDCSRRRDRSRSRARGVGRHDRSCSH